ncbi:hypothetical protein [Haladaptatus cibarius]|uniref:hypothetical protein n=1 Tax=Haladaptatus cibarius TaxID=453847 RepID=UPI000A967D31|nr:hypothetical protein [Haladaptatus cibarius]
MSNWKLSVVIVWELGFDSGEPVAVDATPPSTVPAIIELLASFRYERLSVF